MRATTEKLKKQDIHLVISWKEAEALVAKLGPRIITDQEYDLFCVLSEIVEDSALSSEHTS